MNEIMGVVTAAANIGVGSVIALILLLRGLPLWSRMIERVTEEHCAMLDALEEIRNCLEEGRKNAESIHH